MCPTAVLPAPPRTLSAATSPADFFHSALSIAAPLARSNALRILGIASHGRVSTNPELPTLAEEGVEGIEAELWFALASPKPIAHIECFHRSTEALKDQLLGEFGVDPRFDCAEDVDVDQDLSVFCFIAKSGGQICHLARH